MGKPKPKKYFSREILISQLNEILRNFEINQAEFNHQIGVAQAFTKWKKTQIPSAESLLAISQVFGVSIDQLLTGEQPVPALVREPSAETYETRPLGELETALLQQVNAVVDAGIREEKAKLTTEEKFAVLTRVYNDCAEDRKPPDTIMVKRYIWAFSKAKG